jgi:lysophospholipase L1-like esterase
MSPAASALTSGSLLLARTFNKAVGLTNSPIIVTATLTNLSADALRGFYYFDEVPTGLMVTTVSVTLNGVGLTNFSYESGLDGAVDPGCTRRQWWLETPTNFAEANPVPPQGVVQIVFSLSCASTGTFVLQDFGCAASTPGNTNTLYGYSVAADQQTVSFVPSDGPIPGGCVAAPAGIVGWWPGAGNANDIAGTDNGSLLGGATAAATGFDGTAFSFDGTNGYAQIPDASALRPTNLTIEAWVQFSSLNSFVSGASLGDQYIVFKQNTRSGDFEGYALSKTRVGGTDVFAFVVTSESGQSAVTLSTTALAAGVWYHVAAVRGTNFTQIYVNGRLEGQGTVSFAQDYGAHPLYFGTSGVAGWDARLKGLLDEVSLYSRALSSNEVAAIYAAGASGKCPVAAPLSISAQPRSQNMLAGGTVQFTVTAMGPGPLSYQWRWNGIKLADGSQLSGSGRAALTVNNAQAANAGSYSVVVTNATGAVTSAVAILTVTPSSLPPCETSDIGALWSDNFDRSSLGTDWIVLGGANATIVSNQLCLAQTDNVPTRQMYYQPWLTCSDHWTLRWTERFGSFNAASLGVGVGLKNFQAAGGNDRNYNALLSGAGSGFGTMGIERYDGSSQVPAASGPAIALAAGDVVDCSFTRAGWTMSVTASNRANGQVSTTSIVYSMAANLIAPTISRICLYPLGGTVYVDNISFSIDHRKPARFIVIGASTSEAYNASSYEKGCVNVLQSYFTEAVCNDSSAWNSTSNSVSILPEILAHQPQTAILMVGGNDLLYGYPASQWQGQYSLLVSQLQAQGVKVKFCLPSPRNGVDLRPFVNWITSTYPAADVIDAWTPFLQGASSLNPFYDSGDGTHPNDAGHQLIAQIIATNLLAAVVVPPRSQLLAPLAQGGAMNLILSGQAGSVYAIEISTDLLHWSDLKRLTLPGSTAQISDTLAPSPRFYRARWVQ